MKFKNCGVTATIPQRLMSGALYTSMQNSFLNLFVLKYLRYRADKRRFKFTNDDTLC